MDQETFAERLQESAQRAREFAQTALIEELPEAIMLRLRLTSSYAGVKLWPDVAQDFHRPRAMTLRWAGAS